MRTLAITQNITLDGAVEMLDDWFDAQGQADSGDLLAENRRQSAATDTVLLGRRTFTDMRGYWRDLADDTTGVSTYLNRVEKVVVSGTLVDPDWAGTTVLSGDVVDGIRRLKQRPGRDIVLTGSITLAHEVIAAGLVDEFRLFVYPVVQGRGRRLFPDEWRPGFLERVDVRAFGGGVTSLVYRTPQG